MKGGTRKRGKTWSYYFDTAQVGGKRKKIEKGGWHPSAPLNNRLSCFAPVFQWNFIKFSIITFIILI